MAGTVNEVRIIGKVAKPPVKAGDGAKVVLATKAGNQKHEHYLLCSGNAVDAAKELQVGQLVRAEGRMSSVGDNPPTYVIKAYRITFLAAEAKPEATVAEAFVMGRLGRDPESRSTNEGKAVCNFSVATDYGFGENSTTDWIRATAFERTAEIAGQYLQKGSSVHLSGVIRVSHWTDNDGNDRRGVELSVNRLTLVGKKKESGGGGGGGWGDSGNSESGSGGGGGWGGGSSGGSSNQSAGGAWGTEEDDEDIPFAWRNPVPAFYRSRS